MAAIKGKNTKPEMLVRRFLFSKGLRYRVNDRRLPGTPDIVLKKYKTVIFVDGCFWHGHDGCKYYRLPGTNVDFWRTKIERNRARDAKTHALLREQGWQVLQVWECELKRAADLPARLARLLAQILPAAPTMPTIPESPTIPALPSYLPAADVPLAAEPEEEYGAAGI